MYASIIVALGISLFIYLGFRTEKTLVNQWCIGLLGRPSWFALRTTLQHVWTPNAFIVYSLPGALWIFAITLLSRPFGIPFKKGNVPLWVLPMVVSVGFEVLQYLHVLNGVFDWHDLWSAVVFWGLGMWVVTPVYARLQPLPFFNLHRIVCGVSYAVVYLAHVNP